MKTPSWMESLQGTVADDGNQRSCRISRMNRSGMRLHFAAAVTDCGDDGCKPLSSEAERCLGFAIQLTEEECDCERACMASWGFFAPGQAVAITKFDRIHAVAPCDVLPGDPVVVHPMSGLPAAQGVVARGATWESDAMGGDMAIIQVNTKGARRP